MKVLRYVFSSSLLLLFLAAAAFAQTPKSRHFVFDYNFTVRNTDPGKALQVWFPIAQSDQFQQVRIVSKSSDLALQETHESEYGNRMFYAHTDKADKPEYRFSVKYDVVRYEHLAAVSATGHASQKDLQRFLGPDKLAPITGRPAEIAVEQVKPGMSDMDKGRAL